MDNPIREKKKSGTLNPVIDPLNERPWPIHLKPREDELLSSWLVRLAIAHGLKLHSFCRLVWGSNKQIWNRDIDRFVDDQILQTLSLRTATPIERVKKTMLSEYEGKLFENHNPFGNTPFIMPLGVYHRIRLNKGLQFCSECLRESAHYKRQWRLSFCVLCLKHNVFLRDCCPKCRSPINFHRNELGKKSKITDRPPVFCYMCEFDLRESTSPLCSESILKCLFHFQYKLLEGVETGKVDILGHGPVWIHLYAQVIGQLSKLCSVCSSSKRLRLELNCLLPLFEFTEKTYAKGTMLESFNIQKRINAYYWTSHLLEDWPLKFIKICRNSRTYSSILLKDMTSIPYWYWKIVRENFYVVYSPRKNFK